MSPDARALIFLVGLAALGVSTSRATQVCPQHLQFLESKCEQWQSSVLPKSIPAARGNAFADNEDAAAFGMRIFFDNRFSQSGSGVACSNCHDPEHSFAERKATSHTIREVARNAPDLINAAWYSNAHFWDGKIDTLWSAPLFTFEQEDEMGATRLGVVHTVAAIYKIRYEKIFGPLPDFSDIKRFPTVGKPGMREFDRMSEQDKEIVNRVYVNVGKVLEAYLRKLAAGRSPFDDFINGSVKAISPDAQRGMIAFTRNNCDACHSGPTFSDEAFHDLRLTARPGAPKDLARAGGVAFAKHWQFDAAGKFADPTGGSSWVTKGSNDPKGFRTPTLRNVELTPPYGHNGAYETLDQILDAHAYVLPNHATVDAQDKHDIIAFIHSLSGRPPLRPWNYWPGG